MTIVIRPLLIDFAVIGKPVSLRSRKTKQLWQSLVAEAAQERLGKTFRLDGKLDMQIDWFSRKYQNTADVDNILKPIVDALKNIIYVDDNQVSSISARHHDTNSVITFISEPVYIIEPLLAGEREYVYIRIYEVFD